MSVGQNTASGERLRAFVERIEHERGIQKQAGQNITAIKAEAKAEGYSPPAITYVVRVREMKPHDRQEAEALRDMYLHAMGMATEAPLFRAAGLAGIDTAAREQVIERMRAFVPASGIGDIVVNMGGKSFRLTRDKDGEVVETEIVEKPSGPLAEGKTKGKATPKAEVPDVDATGAEALGRQYARDNQPVIDNPFPFGDARRARFDEGWRREAGSDGMGDD